MDLNPLLTRYWNIEKAARSWMQNYRDYFRHQSSAYEFTPPAPLPPPPPPPPLPPILFSRTRLRKKKQKRKRRRSDVEHGQLAAVVPDEEDEFRSVSSYGQSEIVEEEEVEMELSADVVAFMAQTIRHRIEREKKKAKDQEEQDRNVVFVPADRPFGVSTFNEFGGDAAAVAAMVKGNADGDGFRTAIERRRRELVALYGHDRADWIYGQETLMQMKFNQEYDKYHPPFWPNIPLKL